MNQPITTQQSFRANVDQMVDHAIDVLGLDAGTAEALKTCDSVLQVSIPVKINGQI